MAKQSMAVPQDKLELMLRKTQEDLTRNEMERSVLQQRLEVINDIIESFDDSDDDDEPVQDNSFAPRKRGSKALPKKASNKKAAKPAKRAYKKRAARQQDPLSKAADATGLEPTNGHGHINGTAITNKQPAEGLSWFQLATKTMNRQKFMSAKEITEEIQNQFDLGARKIGTSISATLSGNVKSGRLLSKQGEDGIKYKLV